MESTFEKLYFSFTGEFLPETYRAPDSPLRVGEAGYFFETLQRFEEYKPQHLDHFGRFPAEKSQLYLTGKHKLPVVDAFFDDLFPGRYAERFKYQCTPTFDIDNAYAFRAKGFAKNAGGMFKNMLSDRPRAGARWKTWLNAGADPYDTYAYIVECCKSFGMRPLFFIQTGNYNNGKDTNIPFGGKDGRTLLQYLSAHGDIGLHPSFASNADTDLLKREHAQLSEIIGRPVTKSRQHFLVLRFPETYRRLVELGITEDYSMGWSSQVGFRAGTARPFLWYDMERGAFADLMVYPFACMDGTLHEYLNLPPGEAVDTAAALIDEARVRNGLFTPLWHNHSVNDRWEWRGWRTVFEQMLALACP